MKKLLILISLFFVIASCEKETVEPTLENPNKPTEDEVYKLEKIEYQFSNGEKAIETYDIFTKSLHFSNGTSVAQKVIFDPSENLMESSRFQSVDLIKYVIRDTIGVSVPSTISDNGNITLGQGKWPFSQKTETIPSHVNFKDSVYVQSNKKIDIEMAVNMVKYECSFKALLIGEVSGNKVEINGLWEGRYPVGADIDYNIQDL